MSTGLKKISSYPQGQPQGSDYIPMFDSAGTMKIVQHADFQESAFIH